MKSFLKSERVAELFEVHYWNVLDHARRNGVFMSMVPIRKGGPRGAFMWRRADVERVLGRPLDDSEVA